MVLLSNFVAMQPTSAGAHDVSQSGGNGNSTFDSRPHGTELQEPAAYNPCPLDVRINGHDDRSHNENLSLQDTLRRRDGSRQDNSRTRSIQSQETFSPPQEERHHHHHPHHQHRRHQHRSYQQDHQQYSLKDNPKYSLKSQRSSSQSNLLPNGSSRSHDMYSSQNEIRSGRELSTQMTSSSNSPFPQTRRKNGHVVNNLDPLYMAMMNPEKSQGNSERLLNYTIEKPRLLGGSRDSSSFTHDHTEDSDIRTNSKRIFKSPSSNSISSGLPSHYPVASLIDAGMHNSRYQSSDKQTSGLHTEKNSQGDRLETAFLSTEPSLMTRSADFSSGQSGFWFQDNDHESQTRPLDNSLSMSAKPKRLPAPLDTSMTSTISNAESWSPSYVKMNFPFDNGSSDPIHHPRPRGSSDHLIRSMSSGQMWRSATPADFRERSDSNISTSSMAKVDNRQRSQKQGHLWNHPHVQDSNHDMMTRSLDFSSLSLSNGYEDKDMSIHHAKFFTVGRNNIEARRSVAASQMTSSFHEDLSESFSPASTLPKRGGGRLQHLRRSVSHEPRELKIKPLVIRTASDGEIESEYVTLDWRYQQGNVATSSQVSKISPESILSNSVLCPPAVENTSSSEKCQYCENGACSRKCNINRERNSMVTNEDLNAKNDFSLLNTPDSKLVKSNPSMPHSLQTNTLPLKSKRNFLRKRSASTLQTVEETNNDSSSLPSSNGSLRATQPSCFYTLTHNKATRHQLNNIHPSNTKNINSKSVNAENSKPMLPDSNVGQLSQEYKLLQTQQQQQPAQFQAQPAKLIRSKSLPDLQGSKKPSKFFNSIRNNNDNNNSNDTQNNTNYSDDEDGDDFGFLSYPISFSSSFYCPSTSAAMQKAKSPSPSSRILPKRWRSKNKAVPVVTSSTAMWTPGPAGSCVWSSVSGRKVHLRPVSILTISEAERLALQKIALSTLQSMALECPIVIPKDGTDVRRSKKSALSLKRRSKSLSGSNIDTNGKEASGLVFGIPLNKCIINDRELEKKRRKVITTPAVPGAAAAAAVAATALSSPASPMVGKMRTESADNILASRNTRKSSSSSQGSLENSTNVPHNGTVTPHRQDTLSAPSHKRAASTDSLSESESSRNTSSSLIDALTLSTSHPASRMSGMAVDRSLTANHGELQVPYVVKTCFRHIETYGLHTLGVFRVGCSKKRVKQLREEFDSGKNVELTEEHHPHDVAALLKEYFRDLPEPLLTRDMYLPFLHARRLPEEQKRSLAFSLLIAMLPVVNRDTLWALLRFLGTVSQHAPDSMNDKGETIPGNKMDTHNLATLFGPNVLHRTKSALDKEGSAESAESVEQSKEVIEVVKDMIDNHHELYEISGNLRDDVLRLLVESDQETADRILKHLANQNQIEVDPESMSSVFEDVTGSPVLSHAMNSDADFFAYTKTQSSTSHRPLRVTKSVEDCLDSPVSKSRATHLSDSQVLSECESMKMSGSNTHPRLDLGHSFPSPLPSRVPILRVPQDSSASPEVVLRGRLEVGGGERPVSEGYSQNLSIPRPLYLRENSSSSVSSCLSSSQNSHGGSDGNNQSGHWVLPTPPASRGTSPKPFFRSASSSSTLIPMPSPARFNHSHTDEDEAIDKSMRHRNPEWERERWRQWEMIASEKRNSEAEQETLV